MVVGNCSKASANAGFREKKREAGDQDTGDRRRVQVKLTDKDAGDLQGKIGNADFHGVDIGIPHPLGDTFEHEAQPDGGHEENDGWLIDQRAQHRAFDGHGKHDHHDDGEREGPEEVEVASEKAERCEG
jgi:hypothetical protein